MAKKWYPSIFKKVIRSIKSTSDPVEIEKALREMTAGPSILETFATYEDYALSIIEKHGYQFNKPYNYFDAYKHDRGEQLLTAKIKADIGTEDWNMTYAGRAAEILNHCQQLKSSMEGKKIENTAHHAMLLQQEVDHLNFMQWEYPARVGEKQLVAKNVAYTAKDKASWQARFNQLMEETPGISKRKAAEIIQSEAGHDSESIRKYIKE